MSLDDNRLPKQLQLASDDNASSGATEQPIFSKEVQDRKTETVVIQYEE